MDSRKTKPEMEKLRTEISHLFPDSILPLKLNWSLEIEPRPFRRKCYENCSDILDLKYTHLRHKIKFSQTWNIFNFNVWVLEIYIYNFVAV